jgi:preprotein translocase SecE subunit
MIARIKSFFGDSWLELKKVIWPSFDDVMKMTGLTVAVVFIVGTFMFLWGEILTVFTQSLFK